MRFTVTGWGAVHAAADTAAAGFRALLDGRSFLAPGTEFGVDAPVARVGCHFDGCRVSALACRAANEALGHADRKADGSGALVFATTKADLVRQRWTMDSGAAPSGLAAQVAVEVAGSLGSFREVHCVSAACASGLVAVGQALLRLRLGLHDWVLVVAADALDEFVVRGFNELRALDPEGCRPFHAARAGLSVGEGAAALVVEGSCDRQRLSVQGYGAASDAYHVTAPHPGGRGLQAAVQAALRGVSPPEVGLLAAHGTGTEYNDKMEMSAYAAVFGHHQPLGIAVKGQIGHTLGAAGLMNVVLSAQALEAGCVPALTHDVDPQCPLQFSKTTISHSASTALACAAGFAGINAALCLSLDAGSGVIATQQKLQSPPKAHSVEAVAWLDDVGEPALWRAAAKDRARRMDSMSLAGCYLGSQALKKADLLDSSGVLLPGHKVGVILATGLGCYATDTAFWLSPSEGPSARPRRFAYTLANIALGELASQCGLHGESLVLRAGTLSFVKGVAQAGLQIASGQWDYALVLGLDMHTADAESPQLPWTKGRTATGRAIVLRRLSGNEAVVVNVHPPAALGDAHPIEPAPIASDTGAAELFAALSQKKPWRFDWSADGFSVGLSGEKVKEST